jgi:hypothetical protein
MLVSAYSSSSIISFLINALLWSFLAIAYPKISASICDYLTSNSRENYVESQVYQIFDSAWRREAEARVDIFKTNDVDDPDLTLLYTFMADHSVVQKDNHALKNLRSISISNMNMNQNLLEAASLLNPVSLFVHIASQVSGSGTDALQKREAILWEFRDRLFGHYYKKTCEEFELNSVGSDGISAPGLSSKISVKEIPSLPTGASLIPINYSKIALWILSLIMHICVIYIITLRKVTKLVMS